MGKWPWERRERGRCYRRCGLRGLSWARSCCWGALTDMQTHSPDPQTTDKGVPVHTVRVCTLVIRAFM